MISDGGSRPIRPSIDRSVNRSHSLPYSSFCVASTSSTQESSVDHSVTRSLIAPVQLVMQHNNLPSSLSSLSKSLHIKQSTNNLVSSHLLRRPAFDRRNVQSQSMHPPSLWRDGGTFPFKGRCTHTTSTSTSTSTCMERDLSHLHYLA
jgi:hypothetical protein